MKRINKILGLGIGIVAVFGLASCTNETTVVDPETPGNDVEEVTLNLVKAPDMVAWTGKQVLGDTRATRGYYEERDESGKTKKYYMHDEEVEVNLSLLKPHDKYDIVDLAAKLSIHVRSANDVTVKLPILANFVVESDDFLIFKDHLEEDIVYGTQIIELLGENQTSHSSVYEINEGNRVTLNVTFDANVVTVSTHGINGEVYETLLNGQDHDGLNFEVYIYLAENDYDKEDFIEDLNDATIEFNGVNSPKYYINAFTANEDGDGFNPNDCTVALVDEDSYSLIGSNNLDHLNGSSYNTIYMLKIAGEDGTLIDPDHAHGGAIEVPSQGEGSDQQPETDGDGEESENEGDGE